MELRYVYRRIEDAIGAPIISSTAPHLTVFQKIRMDFLELRDLCRYAETSALCFASIAGNSGLDVKKSYDRMTRLLDAVFSRKFPYEKDDTGKDKGKPAAENNDYHEYDEYFKYLNELERKRQEKRDAQAKASESKPEGDRIS